MLTGNQRSMSLSEGEDAQLALRRGPFPYDVRALSVLSCRVDLVGDHGMCRVALRPM